MRIKKSREKEKNGDLNKEKGANKIEINEEKIHTSKKLHC